MARRHLGLAALLLGVLLLAGCASDGAIAKGRMRTLLSKAPADAAVKIVILNVEAERGTVMAGEGTLGDVQRTPGVLRADRGAGRNEILVVADLDTDSSYFVDALRPRYRVYVVGEFLREDLAGD